METFSKLRPPDAVRIKVKIVEKSNVDIDNKENKCQNQTQLNNKQQLQQQRRQLGESKKFCVDPQITSYDILTSLIAQAFAIQG
jgi:hypothetical protein